MNNCGGPSRLGTVTLDGEKYAIATMENNPITGVVNATLISMKDGSKIEMSHNFREFETWK